MKKNIYIKWTTVMSLCLALTLLFSFGTLATATTKPYHWYVKRNKEHQQPVLAPEQKIIEAHSGFYVDKKHGNESEDKVIYLTFDAGYENGNVAKILDTLREEEAPAAFFVLKNMIVKETALIKRMQQEGHLVCNHTMSHKDTTKMSQEDFCAELSGLSALYKEHTGTDMPSYYRPPEGKYDEKTLCYAADMGYKTIFWSLAYADWDNDKQPDTEKAKKILLDNTHNGAVILLHPTSATNAAILKDMICEWKNQGYRFGTLDELTATC